MKNNLEDAKEVKTSMHPYTSLGLEKEFELADHTKYRQMIRSLLYLTTFRPNIIFTIYICANFSQI